MGAGVPDKTQYAGIFPCSHKPFRMQAAQHVKSGRMSDAVPAPQPDSGIAFKQKSLDSVPGIQSGKGLRAGAEAAARAKGQAGAAGVRSVWQGRCT